MPEQETMQDLMKTAQPGKEHVILAQLAGEWNTVMRVWMSPDDPPAEAKGLAIVKSLLGGRLLTEELHAKFGDMDFEGFGTMGHDNFRGRFWQTWTDWDTCLYHGEGTASADGKTVTISGMTDRHELNRTNVPRRTVFHFVNDNLHTFEVFEKDPSGKESRTLEMEYRRK
ncbi:MAG TPA: DUF1579 family protein [bacterium]|jgi:hypothetical protein